MSLNPPYPHWGKSTHRLTFGLNIKYLVLGFKRDFSRHIPEVWSIPYRYGTFVIWIKREYWPDSRSTDDKRHRARYPNNFDAHYVTTFFSKVSHLRSIPSKFLLKIYKIDKVMIFSTKKLFAQLLLNFF